MITRVCTSYGIFHATIQLREIRCPFHSFPFSFSVPAFSNTIIRNGQRSSLRSSSVQTNRPSARLYTDGLSDEPSFYEVRLDSSSCVYT